MWNYLLSCTGESEEQYQRTEELVRAIGFDRVNTAAYSPRPNTPAAEWDNQVADLVKADRLNRLNAVVTEVRVLGGGFGLQKVAVVEGTSWQAEGQEGGVKKGFCTGGMARLGYP